MLAAAQEAADLLARFREAKNIRISESGDHHDKTLALWMSWTNPLPPAGAVARSQAVAERYRRKGYTNLYNLVSLTNGDGTAITSGSYALQDPNSTPYWGVMLKRATGIDWYPASNGTIDARKTVPGHVEVLGDADSF